jgi:hypothetical protein
MRKSANHGHLAGATFSRGLCLIAPAAVGIGVLGFSKSARANLVIVPTFDSTINSDPNAAAIKAGINATIARVEADVTKRQFGIRIEIEKAASPAIELLSSTRTSKVFRQGGRHGYRRTLLRSGQVCYRFSSAIQPAAAARWQAASESSRAHVSQRSDDRSGFVSRLQLSHFQAFLYRASLPAYARPSSRVCSVTAVLSSRFPAPWRR